MSKNYNVEDFSKMIQCYLDCGRDVELGLKMYKSIYPDRKKPLLNLLCNIVEGYDHSKKEKQSAEFIKSLNDSIVNYFAKNSHATIRKAACIFSLPIRYVTHLLVEREEEIQAKRQEYEIMREESKNNSIQETIEKAKQALKQEILCANDSEEDMSTTTTLNYTNTFQGEFNIKEEDESVIEVSESETADSDNVSCKTKKRKKKYSKCGKSNKRRASESRRRCIEDASSATHRPYRKRPTKHFPPHSSSTSYSPSSLNSTILDMQMRTPIVYTTRLEEMTICNKNVENLENAVIIKEILAESKPRFNNIKQRSNLKVIKTICLGLINIVLNKLMNKNTITESSEKAYNNNNDGDDEVSIVPLENNTAQRGKLLQTQDVSGLHDNTDVIVIDNMFSKLRDTYVIGGGKLLEYHCTKLDTDEVEKTSETKFTLSACCWFGRQQNVEIMWPSDKYPFSRFLKSRHECSLDKCACCCKPLNDCTELKPSFHKSANNDVKYATIGESDAKQNDPILLAALNYKNPVSNENIINNVHNTRSKYFFNPTRVLISDTSKGVNRNEYYEIGGDQDITRFHIENHWRVGRSRCKVCIMLGPMFGGKQTDSIPACCKWKRDSILRPFVSTNSLRFLQNVNRYQYDKCAACDVESNPVKKKKAFLFDTVPKIGHATVTEKLTFSKYVCSIVRPPDVHNTTVGEMPVVTSSFEVKKKINIQCKEIPCLIFEIGGLKDQEVNNVINKLMHMYCTVKDDSRVVGLFDSSLQSTSPEELQMFAQIIQHIQNRLKATPLPSGSSLSFIAEVEDDFKNSNNQSDFQTELVNQGTLVSSNSNAGNMRPPLTISSHNQNTLPIIQEVVGGRNAPHCSSVTFENYTSFTDTGGTVENVFIGNDEITDNLETSHGFHEFYRRSKKCYEESFKSYVKYEHTVENEDITTPKISSVFSLQNSIQCQIPANESFLTETVSSLPSTSYCNTENAENNFIINANLETNVIPYPHSTLPPMVQKTGQSMIVCDSKTGQLFNLIPVDPNAIFESSIKQNIVTIHEDRESENQLKLLPIESNPLNVSNPNVPIIIPSFESMEPESILPDILNDIPKNVIVKQEPYNDDVIVLDSD